MKRMKTWALAGIVALGACKDDDDGDDGAGDATDDGADDMADDADDMAESESGGEPALYDRLGGEEGIRTVVTNAVTAVLADPAINGYFLNAAVDGGRLIDCLVLQLGAATGGPQTYPSGDCRDMVAAHQGLGISAQDFTDLAGHFQTALTDAGVAEPDVMTIMGALAGMQEQIVEDPTNDATVYQRVGRKPAIQAVVGAFIGIVVEDAEINGFFGAVDADRLTTCLVRQVCSIDGPCAYGAEVDGEPGVAASSPCRDMISVHQGMVDDMGDMITIDDFNALAGDLVTAMTDAGVPQADQDAILGVLGPMCADIVADPAMCPG
jgi:truncated hemoglobin YjbI